MPIVFTASFRAVFTSFLVFLLVLFFSSALLSLRVEPEDSWEGFWRALSTGERRQVERFLHPDAGGDVALLLDEATSDRVLADLIRHWEPRVRDRREEAGTGTVYLDIIITHPTDLPSLSRGLQAAVSSLSARVPRESLQTSQMKVSLARANGLWWIKEISLPEPVREQFMLMRGELFDFENLAAEFSTSMEDGCSLTGGYAADGRGYLQVSDPDGRMVELVQLPSFDVLSEVIPAPATVAPDSEDLEIGPAHWRGRELDDGFVLGGTGPDRCEYLFYLDERGRLDEQVVLDCALFSHVDGDHFSGDGRFILESPGEDGPANGEKIFDLRGRDFLSVHVPEGSSSLYRGDSGVLWMETGEVLRYTDGGAVLMGAGYEYQDLLSGESLSIDPGSGRLVPQPHGGALSFCPGEGRLAFISTGPLRLPTGSGKSGDGAGPDQVLVLDGEERTLPGGQMEEGAAQKYLSIYCFYENEIIADAPIPLKFSRLAEKPDVKWLNSRYLYLSDGAGREIYYDLAGPVFRHYLPNDRAERLQDMFFTEGGWDDDARKIALTFDDGPDPVHTPEVLSILREYDVPATFFVLGNNVDKWPEITRRIVEEGHVLGNHSRDHSRVAGMSADAMYRRQIEPTQEIISDVVGFEPSLFRPPYGDVTDFQIRYLAERGIQTVNWSVDPEDWDPETGGAEEIARRAIHYSYEGAIILLHASDTQESAHTVEALPEIISVLQERGYSFVTIPELLDIDEERAPQE